MKRTLIGIIALLIVCLSLEGCAPAPPHDQNNICAIFRQYNSWYWDAQEVHKKWGLPISVMMAIIHQESHFKGNAAPPREHILWVIPWFRPTSAYGYSQAVDGTWKLYEKQAGSMFSMRDEFGDAANFVGWFAERAHRKAGISMDNAYELYLAYHEGIDGYKQGTYRHKAWLIKVARDVQFQAWRYHRQLLECRASLPKKPWWHIW